MTLLVDLGLAVRTESGVKITGKKKKPLSETEIKKFETMHRNFIELWTFRCEKMTGHLHKIPIQITYNDEIENPISKWFHNANRADPDNTFLFCDTLRSTEGIYGNYFIPWNVEFICFTNPAKKFKTEYGTTVDTIEILEKNDVIEAKDDGTLHTFVDLLLPNVILFNYCIFIRWSNKEFSDAIVESDHSGDDTAIRRK